MPSIEELPKLIQKFYDPDSLVYYNDDTVYFNYNVDKRIIEDLRNSDLQVYTGYYTYKKGWHSPKIYLNCRGRLSGKIKLKIENYLPNCYVESKSGSYKTIYGKNVEKILFRAHPSIVKRFRKKLSDLGYPRPYEADVPFVRRFLLDVNFLKSSDIIRPVVAIIDIETNFPKDKTIISYALNKDGSLYFRSIHDFEYKDLLNQLIKDLDDVDIITGWNVDYDIEIINREISRVLDIETNKFIENNYAVIDMMALTKKMYGREIRGSWSLDNTGIRLCGIGKVDIGNKYPRDLPYEKLLEYNVMDVIIPEILDNYLGSIDCHLQLSWMSQCTLEDSLVTAIVNDIVILRAYHVNKVVLPSRPEWNEKLSGESYAAAKPLAREGKYDGILKFDMVHAYPNSVIAINASIETLDPNGELASPNGIRFNKGSSVFINELKRLMSERAKAKQKYKQYSKLFGKDSTQAKKYKYIDFALKTQVAAFSHGIFGWKHSRIYAPEVASAITSTARDLIFFAMKHADLIGYKWVYQHTDSLYINAPKEKAEVIKNYFNSIISNYCKKKGYIISAKLEFKDFYPMIYVHSAGRNVLLPKDVDIDDDEGWEVTGMNFFRSETPEALAEIEINLIKMIFKNKPKDEMLSYLKESIKNLENVNLSKLALIKPLNKKIESYGRVGKDGNIVGIPNHVKALMRAMKEYNLDIPVGSKFMILPIVTNETVGKRKIRRKRVDIAFTEDNPLPSNYKIDWETYLKSNLFGKINKMFGMSESELYKECEEVIKELMYER